MSKKSETSVEDREVIVKLALEGKSLRQIGKIVGRSRSTVHGIVKKFMDYGITSNKQRTGRKPILNETEKRNIFLEILRDPHQSVPKLTSDIITRIGRPVSCVTVRRVVRTVKTTGFQGITDVGDCSSGEEEEKDEENSSANDGGVETEERSEFPNEKVHHRKEHLYEKIRKQMEFYFSDANLTKDHLLGKLILKDPNIDISVFLRVDKIRELTRNPRDIVNALRSSELLSVSEDGTKVFRTPQTQNEQADDSSIYTGIGTMDCPSTQTTPEKLHSIQTFDVENVKSEAISDKEIKRNSRNENSDNSSRKKEKKENLQYSEDTNIEGSNGGDDVDEEDDDESNRKRKKSDINETEDCKSNQGLIGDEALPKKIKKEED